MTFSVIASARADTSIQGFFSRPCSLSSESHPLIWAHSTHSRLTHQGRCVCDWPQSTRHATEETVWQQRAGPCRLQRPSHPQRGLHRPEIAGVGLTEDQAKAQGIKVKKGLFPWTASGRAIANGRDEGFTKLLFDDSPEAHGHGRILGGGIVGTHAGDVHG